jgi:hypothetical protein
VKVISFDDQRKDLNEFTSNRETLALGDLQHEVRSGNESLRRGRTGAEHDPEDSWPQGDRALYDGMDWHSDSATFEGSVRGLDEEGVTVYPIRYDTRATTERLAREQSGQDERRVTDDLCHSTTTSERHDSTDVSG